MSFAWNLKQKAVQDKNASPCVIFQNDMMATRPISCISLGPLKKNAIAEYPTISRECQKKQNIYLASQTVLLISLWAETVESTVLFSWSLLLSFAEG